MWAPVAAGLTVDTGQPWPLEPTLSGLSFGGWYGNHRNSPNFPTNSIFQQPVCPSSPGSSLSASPGGTTLTRPLLWSG